jgi:4,5-dihydroxyphthalate decarboxylase
MAGMKVALGDYGKDPALRARVVAVTPVEFAEVSPISRAFAPMVREGAFDLSEMALFTFLIAKAHGKPLVLLPAVAAVRFQESALLCRTESGIRGPADLAGKRIGVRAYSQTTGAWLRGTLPEEFGVRPERSRWVTFEDAHVAEYSDPPWCERASGDMMGMLRDGALDAVIVGNDVPDDPGLRTVFSDPAAAGERFRARHGFVPVNHVMCMKRDVDQDVAARVAEATGKVVAKESLTPVIELAVRFAVEQGLIARALSVDEVWA